MSGDAVHLSLAKTTTAAGGAARVNAGSEQFRSVRHYSPTRNVSMYQTSLFSGALFVFGLLAAPLATARADDHKHHEHFMKCA